MKRDILTLLVVFGIFAVLLLLSGLLGIVHRSMIPADAHMTLERGTPADTLAIDRILYVTYMDGVVASEWYGPDWNELFPQEGEWRVEVWDTHGTQIRRARVTFTEVELIPATDYIPHQEGGQ